MRLLCTSAFHVEKGMRPLNPWLEHGLFVGLAMA